MIPTDHAWHQFHVTIYFLSFCHLKSLTPTLYGTNLLCMNSYLAYKSLQYEKRMTVCHEKIITPLQTENVAGHARSSDLPNGNQNFPYDDRICTYINTEPHYPIVFYIYISFSAQKRFFLNRPTLKKRKVEKSSQNWETDKNERCIQIANRTP
jgi:hypothetical protein